MYFYYLQERSENSMRCQQSICGYTLRSRVCCLFNSPVILAENTIYTTSNFNHDLFSALLVSVSGYLVLELNQSVHHNI